MTKLPWRREITYLSYFLMIFSSEVLILIGSKRKLSEAEAPTHTHRCIKISSNYHSHNVHNHLEICHSSACNKSYINDLALLSQFLSFTFHLSHHPFNEFEEPSSFLYHPTTSQYPPQYQSVEHDVHNSSQPSHSHPPNTYESSIPPSHVSASHTIETPYSSSTEPERTMGRSLVENSP